MPGWLFAVLLLLPVIPVNVFGMVLCLQTVADPDRMRQPDIATAFGMTMPPGPNGFAARALVT
jgi:hypothetical protein